MTADTQNRPIAAAGLMIAAMAVIGFIDNYIAMTADHISLWQFQIMRSVLAIFLVIGMAFAGMGTIRPNRFWAVAVRSLFITTGLFCYFGALAFMPIAQALAGLFTSPVFVLLIAAFGRGVKIGPWQVLAVVLGFVGILVVLDLSPETISPVMLMPVAGGFFYALGTTATRSLCEGESAVSLMMGQWIIQILIGGAALAVIGYIAPTVPSGADGFLVRPWVWAFGVVMPVIILQAVGSVVAVWMLTRAYQLGEASQVAVFEYSVMIFGPLFAFLLFAEPLTMQQALGIAMIASAGILIATKTSKLG